MKVKILKSDGVAWYKDNIGQIFEVSDEIYMKNYRIREFVETTESELIGDVYRKVDLGNDMSGFINMNNAIVLRDINFKELGI